MTHFHSQLQKPSLPYVPTSSNSHLMQVVRTSSRNFRSWAFVQSNAPFPKELSTLILGRDSWDRNTVISDTGIFTKPGHEMIQLEGVIILDEALLTSLNECLGYLGRHFVWYFRYTGWERKRLKKISTRALQLIVLKPVIPQLISTFLKTKGARFPLAYREFADGTISAAHIGCRSEKWRVAKTVRSSKTSQQPFPLWRGWATYSVHQTWTYSTSCFVAITRHCKISHP